MKIDDKLFQEIYERIAKEIFFIFKQKLKKEINNLKKDNIDANQVVNILISALSLIDGNIYVLCKDIYKDINMKKVFKIHQENVASFVESATKTGKL